MPIQGVRWKRVYPPQGSWKATRPSTVMTLPHRKKRAPTRPSSTFGDPKLIYRSSMRVRKGACGVWPPHAVFRADEWLGAHSSTNACVLFVAGLRYEGKALFKWAACLLL